MNEFLLALGTVLFAISGGTNFYVEYRRPSESQITNRLIMQKHLDPPIAEEAAKKIKRRERMLWFFIPWIVGMCFSAASFFAQ